MHSPNNVTANPQPTNIPASKSIIGNTSNTPTNNAMTNSGPVNAVQANNVEALNIKPNNPQVKKPPPPNLDRQENARGEAVSSKHSLPVNQNVGITPPPPSHVNASRSKEGLNERRLPPRPPTSDEQEDTMNNLRKTFAGIFGDM